MNNIFEASTLTELVNRINKLSPQSKNQWGTMNVSQMLAHCCEPIAIALGDKTGKRTFMGLLFGKFAKKMVTGNEPFKKNLPTDPSFKIIDSREFNKEKDRLILLVTRLSKKGEVEMGNKEHPFFGNMTAREWSIAMVKHLDHHLTQFGA